jgi:hypothetical protein
VIEHIEQPPGRRNLWRRPWPWIAVGVVVVLLAGVVTGVFVSMSSHSSAQSPSALLTRVLQRTDATAVAAGGVWTFEDKTPWVPSDTSGYTGVPCGDLDSGPQQYPVQLNSGGVADPASAAARVVQHWKSLGYQVRTVVPTQASNAQYTEVAADFPNGAGIVYTVSTKVSAIDALSECSSDPGMLLTTK